MRQTVVSGVSRPTICQLIKPTDPCIVGADPYFCSINTDSRHLVAGKTILCRIGSPNLCFFIIERYPAIAAKPNIVAINSDTTDFIAGESIFYCDCLPDVSTDVVFAHPSTCADPDVFLTRSDAPNLVGQPVILRIL